MTLDEIRAASSNVFPVERLAGCKTAACFFASLYNGRQDAIHLFDAGVEQCVLVDADHEKLVTMARPYMRERPRWTFIAADAFRYAKFLASVRESRDVVTADPPSQLIPDVLREFRLWQSIAEKVLVLGCSAEWLDGNEATPEGVDARLEAVLGPGLPRCVEVRKRSDFNGGQFWAVWEPR